MINYKAYKYAYKKKQIPVSISFKRFHIAVFVNRRKKVLYLKVK